MMKKHDKVESGHFMAYKNLMGLHAVESKKGQFLEIHNWKTYSILFVCELFVQWDLAVFQMIF